MPQQNGGQRISVDGIGRYDTVDCERFDVDGTCSVSGDVLADHVGVDGTVSIGGRLDAHDLDADGSLTVARDAHVDLVRVDGAVDVGENLDAHQLSVDGALDVGGSVVASEMHVDGAVEVSGVTDVTTLDLDGAGSFATVNVETLTGSGALDAADAHAHTFTFAVGGDSTVDHLRATKIRVSRSDRDSSLLGRIVGVGDGTFTAETIEGETVELDGVDADTVVGERVTLGPDCEVGVVYTDDLDADPAARVGERHEYDAY